MPSLLLTPPAAEPVSVAEAKAFLRVEHGDDDGVIAALVSAARIHVEAQIRRALIAQGWRLSLDAWPADGRIPVRPAPVREVSAARVYDSDGETQTIDTQAFVVDSAGSLLAFAPWALPVPGRAVAGAEIDVECGYGESAEDVPEPLRQAVRLLTAHWYENRGVVATQGGALLPANVAALIAPYRMLAL